MGKEVCKEVEAEAAAWLKVIALVGKEVCKEVEAEAAAWLKVIARELVQ